MLEFGIEKLEIFQVGEDVYEDDSSYLKQPLLYIMINQPNLYISQQHLTQKIQVKKHLYFFSAILYVNVFLKWKICS